MRQTAVIFCAAWPGQGVGHGLRNPDIDFAKIAQGHGVWAEGPISDPAQLRGALQRALAEVKQGRPALVDVVCQAR
ncbi:MAG: thiamine pyrophosphate-dependent enzyme [Burkholderiaceae bacterium]